MLSTFTKSIDKIDLDFHRFHATEDELQYVVSYMPFTRYEILMILKKNEDGNWRFVYKATIPKHLHDLEDAIDETIKSNERA